MSPQPLNSQSSRLTPFSLAFALLGALLGLFGAGCSSSEGVGNLLAGQACDSFTINTDPHCACCSTRGGSCISGRHRVRTPTALPPRAATVAPRVCRASPSTVNRCAAKRANAWARPSKPAATAAPRPAPAKTANFRRGPSAKTKANAQPAQASAATAAARTCDARCSWGKCEQCACSPGDTQECEGGEQNVRRRLPVGRLPAVPVPNRRQADARLRQLRPANPDLHAQSHLQRRRVPGPRRVRRRRFPGLRRRQLSRVLQQVRLGRLRGRRVHARYYGEPSLWQLRHPDARMRPGSVVSLRRVQNDRRVRADHQPSVRQRRHSNLQQRLPMERLHRPKVRPVARSSCAVTAASTAALAPTAPGQPTAPATASATACPATARPAAPT